MFLADHPRPTSWQGSGGGPPRQVLRESGQPRRADPARHRPEVARLLREAEASATAVLRGQRDALGRVVDLLLERETIDGSELAAIAANSDPSIVSRSSRR